MAKWIHFFFLAFSALPALGEEMRSLTLRACLRPPGDSYTTFHANGTMEGHTDPQEAGEVCKNNFVTGEGSEVKIGVIEVPAAEGSTAKFTVEWNSGTPRDNFNRTVRSGNLAAASIFPADIFHQCLLEVRGWPPETQVTLWPFEHTISYNLLQDTPVGVVGLGIDLGEAASNTFNPADVHEFALGCTTDEFKSDS